MPARPQDPPPPESRESAFSSARRGFARFNVRDCWWALLDAWEDNRRFRRITLSVGLAALTLGVASIWVYPWWQRRTTVNIARKWLDMGRLDFAAEEIKHALEASPDRPEVLLLAAEFERRTGNPAHAAEHSGQASDLVPDDADTALLWATDALRADQPAVAHRALARLTPEARDASAPALRLLGELARRDGKLDEARARYLEARRLDGPGPLNEVPLGRLLLLSSAPDERTRGRTLLNSFATDSEWGAIALRALLADALTNGDSTERLRLADALRTHPRCAVEDMPTCLRILAEADPARFGRVLGELQARRAANPDEATQLVEWLNQIGHGTDAARWALTLPARFKTHAALQVATAESFRLAADWPGLATRTESGDWGAEYEFLRLAYALEAARRLGQDTRRAELWQTLRGRIANNGIHAYYAASALYLWGLTDEAVVLAQLAATDPKVAVPALGMLARHYQLQHDAPGQYRVFRRLQTLRPGDADVENNFAYFAALTGQNLSLAESLASKNHQAAPMDLGRLATYAFTLVMQNRPADAITLLEPVSTRLNESPGLALAYGLALARTRQKDAARTLLVPLLATAQTDREAELIKAAVE